MRGASLALTRLATGDLGSCAQMIPDDPLFTLGQCSSLALRRNLTARTFGALCDRLRILIPRTVVRPAGQTEG